MTRRIRNAAENVLCIAGMACMAARWDWGAYRCFTWCNALETQP